MADICLCKCTAHTRAHAAYTHTHTHTAAHHDGPMWLDVKGSDTGQWAKLLPLSKVLEAVLLISCLGAPFLFPPFTG